MTDATSRHWLRDRSQGDSAEVGYVELFFDLVFFFATTQLSHYLLENLSPEGAMRTLLLFVAVWWVWIYTTWVTHWLDPDRAPVRFLLFTLMLAGLLLSVSIPEAFGEQGLAFALAYVAMQVGRSFFLVWALTRANHEGRTNFQRVTAWLLLSSLFWLGGALVENDTRYALWAIAVGLELLSPSIGFWVPRLGRSSPEEWDVEGPHLAERCALFIIIALGESLLLTSATLDEGEYSLPSLVGLVFALATAVAMWWIYFDTGARRGERALERSAEPGRLAQLAYTYMHMPIVAGVVVTAVGDEKVLAEPLGHSDWTVVGPILGGPALFERGNLHFKMAVFGRLPISHIAGLAVLAGLALEPWRVEPLALTAGSTLALILVAVLEMRLARSRTAAASNVT